MKKQTGAFTIVELVIVIAIITILAAVLVPTFGNIIRTARESSDTQIVRNMNTAITVADSAGEINSFGDVITTLQNAGFILGNLNPSAEGWVYVWENNSRQMIIVDTSDNSVRYTSKQLTDKTPGESWYVVTNKQSVADHFKNLNCKASIVASDAGFVPTEGSSVSDAIENADNGDYIIVSGKLTFNNTTISKDLNFVSVDGTAVVENNSLTVKDTANVTFQNVSFKNATSLSSKASSFYGSGTKGKIVLDGCTFLDPQWEGVQITPVDGAEIVIKNCNFVVTENAYHECKVQSNNTVEVDGKLLAPGCHRMLHIQATKNTDCNAKITLVNNTFVGCDRVDEAIMDIDFVDYENRMTAYGNVFKNMDGSDTGIIDNGLIYICNSAGTAMDYTEAYNFVTKK